jgi:hypothetical protein
MKGIELFASFFLTLGFFLYAEAPELRNVMPNSWQKLTRLSAEEEQEFIKNNNRIIEQGIEKSDLSKSGYTYSENPIPRIYKQMVGNDTFYRIIITQNSEHDFDEWLKYFAQVLVYQSNEKNNIIAFGEYNKRNVNQWTNISTYNSIDIIEEQGNVKGILITALNASVNGIGEYSNIVKGQATGKSSAIYLLTDDIKNVTDINTQYFSLDNVGSHLKEIIKINSSDCLVDPNIPLRYSLQNAFDGNPATSYVENTEDDLIQIVIMGIKRLNLQKIALINGYATNQSLYQDNNRIKKFNTENIKKVGNTFEFSESEPKKIFYTHDDYHINILMCFFYKI